MPSKPQKPRRNTATEKPVPAEGSPKAEVEDAPADDLRRPRVGIRPDRERAKVIDAP